VKKILINSSFFSIPKTHKVDIAENCKDSLEIVDPESRKSLYRGCAELSRPVQIKSMSNTVEVRQKMR
jgi:hypothetical protein